MSEVANNRILRITRLLVYLIMGLIAVAGVVVALVSVILPFFWQEAAQEIAKQNALMDTQALLPKLYAIFALGILTLGLVWTGLSCASCLRLSTASLRTLRLSPRTRFA